MQQGGHLAKRFITGVIVSFSILGCTSKVKEEKKPKKPTSTLETAAAVVVPFCNNVTECIVVTGGAVAMYDAARAAKIIDDPPSPPQPKDSKFFQLVVKCYMVDPDSQFRYPCGNARVNYLSNKNKWTSLIFKGETFEIMDFAKDSRLEVQLEACAKSQFLEKVSAGSVVQVQFSTNCEKSNK